jgi:hypothetical protein
MGTMMLLGRGPRTPTWSGMRRRRPDGSALMRGTIHLVTPAVPQPSVDRTVLRCLAAFAAAPDAGERAVAFSAGG